MTLSMTKKTKIPERRPTDIILQKTFLQTKGESRNVEEIPPANLDEFIRGMKYSFCNFFFLGKSRNARYRERKISVCMK